MCLVQPPVTLSMRWPGEGETSEAELLPLWWDRRALPSLQGTHHGGESCGLLQVQPSVLNAGLPRVNGKREDTLYTFCFN